MGAGYEVEIKYRVADPAALVGRITGAGGTPSGPAVAHADTYFAHPGRDFRQTGEAFRIRTEGADNALTYKGPKRGGPAKTREEIEIGFQVGPDGRDGMAALLDRLGFRPVATVRKSRSTYSLTVDGRALLVTIDEAEGLGTFSEVETLAGSESDLPGAQAAVVALGERLGLDEVEPRSYLRMHLEQRGLMG